MTTYREQKILAFQKEASIEQAADNWKEKQSLLKQAEKEAQMAQEELLMACGQMPYEGKGIKVVEIERKGSVDYSAIEILKNVDLEPYRKPSAKYWKVTLSLVQ